MTKQAKKIVTKSLDQATPLQAAVLADLLLGLSFTAAARKYGVSPGAVSQWKKQFGVKLPDSQIGRNIPLSPDNRITLLPRAGLDVEKIPNPTYNNPKSMGEQFYDYLEASLTALKSQLRVAGDESYIKRQNAHDLATLHNVIGTRAAELFNAFATGQRAESGEEED